MTCEFKHKLKAASKFKHASKTSLLAFRMLWASVLLLCIFFGYITILNMPKRKAEEFKYSHI